MELSIAFGLLSLLLGFLLFRFFFTSTSHLISLPFSPSTYGSWALVTGASSGLGKHFALSLAEKSFSLILVARREELLVDLAKEIETSYKVNTRIIAADLSTLEGVSAVLSGVKDLVDLGILVNNAGFGYTGAFKDQDPSRLAAMIFLNCTAPLLLISGLLSQFRSSSPSPSPSPSSSSSSKRRAIINVSSASALQPLPYHATYAATKSFLSSLGMGIYEELKHLGIDVLTIEPGTVGDTDFRATSGAKKTASSSSESSGSGVTTSGRVVEDTFKALTLKISSSSSFGSFLSLASPSIVPGSSFARVRARIAAALMALGGDWGRRLALKIAAKRNLKLLSTYSTVLLIPPSSLLSSP